MPKLYNANDGITGRDGGPYLDQVEAKHAEDHRAAVEGREPDYDTMGGYAGTVYLTAAQLLANESVNSLPSKFTNNDTKDEALAALAEDPENNFKVAFDAPDVPDDDGLNVDQRQAVTDKALGNVPEKKTKTRATSSK